MITAAARWVIAARLVSVWSLCIAMRLNTFSVQKKFPIYLPPTSADTEAHFQRLKPSMLRVADVKTFENFVVTLRVGVDPDKYAAVIVWCDTFGEIITAARYQ